MTEEGLLVVRLDGSVQAFDAVAEKLLGLDPGRLRIGTRVTEVIECPELTRLLESGDGRGVDGRLEFADLPISWRGRDLLIRWTYLSATVAERPSLLLKLRAVGSESDVDAARALVSRLSLELRAPVAAIRGCSATLLGGALDELERARRFVEMVQHNAGQLEEIADDLSALAQVERGWIATHCSAVDLSPLLGALAHRHAELGMRRGVAVRGIAPSERLVVAAVPRLLEQSLLGVVSELLRGAKSGDEVVCQGCVGECEDAAQITVKRRPRDRSRASAADVSPSEASDEAASIRMATVRDVVRGHGGRVSFETSCGRLDGVHLHWPLWRAESARCAADVTNVLPR